MLSVVLCASVVSIVALHYVLQCLPLFCFPNSLLLALAALVCLFRFLFEYIFCNAKLVKTTRILLRALQRNTNMKTQLQNMQLLIFRAYNVN